MIHFILSSKVPHKSGFDLNSCKCFCLVGWPASGLFELLDMIWMHTWIHL